jgi:hypothetical protein
MAAVGASMLFSAVAAGERSDCAITRSLPPRGAAIVPNGPSAGMALSLNAPRFGLEFVETGAIIALG